MRPHYSTHSQNLQSRAGSYDHGRGEVMLSIRGSLIMPMHHQVDQPG